MAEPLRSILNALFNTHRCRLRTCWPTCPDCSARPDCKQLRCCCIIIIRVCLLVAMLAIGRLARSPLCATAGC
jgi:hypothetical protein